jgi:hypothetical protein
VGSVASAFSIGSAASFERLNAAVRTVLAGCEGSVKTGQRLRGCAGGHVPVLRETTELMRAFAGIRLRRAKGRLGSGTNHLQGVTDHAHA